MHRTLATLGLLAAVSLACQTRQPDMISLIEADTAWRQAMAYQDPDLLQEMLAEEFILEPADEAQPAIDKDTWIRTTVEEMDFGFVNASLNEIELDADGRAVIRQRMELQDWYWMGRPMPASYDLVDTWEWRNGAWRVTSRTSTAAED